jgi:hypothetical protein
VAGCYEHSNEPSDSIKDGEFDWPSVPLPSEEGLSFMELI